MIVSQDFIINKWTNWDAYVSEAIDGFIAIHEKKPNFLAANQHTFSQIDYVLNIVPNSHIHIKSIDENGKEEMGIPFDELCINGYEKGDVKLQFLYDDEQPDGTFYLLNAKDEDFDGNDDNTSPEDYPINDPVQVLEEPSFN